MLVSREFSFVGAHQLPHYQGKCERLHGHTWRLRVTVQAQVGPDGIAFDFAELGRIVRDKVIEKLDHTFLNDMIPNPSAENIAYWVWEQLKELPLLEIRVWESEDTFVTLRREDLRQDA